MAEEVSSIGVKLSLNAGSFMTGMTAATEKTEQFVAATKQAQTVAGRSTGSKTGPSSARAQNVPVDLSISQSAIKRIREQIISGIGTIPIQVSISSAALKTMQGEAKAVMAAVSTPAVGTRSGARVAVDLAVGRNMPKRGMGGSVYANQGVLVGEHRPEVFIPRSSGTIHPDASRYYREEEQRARREMSERRAHEGRMARIRRQAGGPALRLSTHSGWSEGYHPAEIENVRVSTLLKYRDIDREKTPRFHKDYGYLDELTEAMRSGADLGPVVLDHDPRTPGLTKLFDGNHRLAAAQRLGLETLPTRMRRGGLPSDYGFRAGGGKVRRGPSRPPKTCSTCGLVNWQTMAGPERKTCFGCGAPLRGGGGPVYAMAGAAVGSVESRLTRLQRSYTGNIRKAAQRLTPEVLTAGIDWYPGAQEWIGQQATAFGKPEPMVRGMAAALSAGTSWPANKTKVLRILEADAAGKSFPYSMALDAHVKAKKILGGVDPWSLLGHTPKTGQFFLNTGGDLDALTIDRWAYRTATRGAISQYGTGPVRTGSDRAFRKVAKEMGIHPVQLQAALWIQEKYDADLAAGKTPNIAKYMQHGGPVGTLGIAAFQAGQFGSPFAAAEGWAKDPFLAYQAWLATHAQGHHGGGRVHRLRGGETRVSEFPPELRAAYDEYKAAVEEFRPAREAYQKKFPSKEKLSPALLKQEARGIKLQNKFLRLKSQHGFSEPLAAMLHIPGGGWRWAEAEQEAIRGEEYAGPPMSGYGRGQVAGLFTAEEAPFRNLTDASTYARSMVSDERFDTAWQQMWNDIYGGMGHPGQPREGANEAFSNYLKGTHSTAMGMPDESAAWRQKYGHLGPPGGHPTPFKARSAGSFPSTAEFLHGEMQAALYARGMEQMEFPWGEYGERVPGPWAFDYLNEVELNRKYGPAAGMAHDPDWSQTIAGPPRGFVPSPTHEEYTARYNAEQKAKRAALKVRHAKTPKVVPIPVEAPAASTEAQTPAARMEELRGAIKDTQRSDPKLAEVLQKELTKLEASVPQHEAPEVIAHAAVMEHHAETKAAVEEVVNEALAETVAKAVRPIAAAVEPMKAPSGLFTVRRRIREVPSFEEKLGVKVPWLKRGRGGDAGDGLYIVNEMGPEAFIEDHDVGKLRARRPDIYGRIPKAGDGARTGMIQRPSWSMFSPEKNGLIVRREDAQAALAATRAQGGYGFGTAEEDIQSRGPVLRPGAQFVPTGPLEPISRGVRGAGMEAFVAAVKADTAALMAHAEATRKGSTLLTAGTQQATRLLKAGEPIIPLGPSRATGPAILLGPGANAPAGRRPAATGARAQSPEAYTPEMEALVAAYRSGGTAGVADMLDAGGGGGGGRRPYRAEAKVNVKHEVTRAGGVTDIQDRLEELRSTVAGSKAYETIRQPRGMAAVIGAMGLGGGEQARRNQERLNTARRLFEVEGKRNLLYKDEISTNQEEIRLAKERLGPNADVSENTKNIAEAEKTLAANEVHLARATVGLDKAEKAVLPTTGGLIKSFGSIVLATSAYGAAFSAAQVVIEKGLVPAIASWADQMTGWQATSSKTTSAMAEQIRSSHGNVDAVESQIAANAGLSKSAMAYVDSALTQTAVNKAGAQAQAETGGLFRAALGAPNAPQGLYGGYGGVLNSGLLAGGLGGGAGLTESIAGFFSGGGGQSIPEAINKGLSFVTDQGVRDYIDQNAKEQGNPLGVIAGIPGGLGDIFSGLNPFGQNFGFGMKNSAGVAYGSIPGAGAGAGGSYVPPVLAGASDTDKKAFKAYMEDLGSAIDRGAEAAHTGAVAHYDYAKSTDEVTKGLKAAAQAGDTNGTKLALQGVILRDNTGAVIDNGAAYQKANEQLAKGKTIADIATWVGMNTRALQAQQQAGGIMAQRQINVEIPFETTKQLLQQPLISPGAGFLPGTKGPGTAPTITAALGLSTGASAVTQSALADTAKSNLQLQDIARQGMEQTRADIAQFTPENLPQFDQLTKEANASSQAIGTMTQRMANMNQEASQANWSNQIRLARRALGDALALEGKTGGMRLGQLQREQFLIGRASQALNLALQQRQITTQLAIAGFQAPGQTGEERYMRQKEALAEAAIGQRQLGFARRDFTVAGQMWAETARRAATDAQHAIDVMQKARDAEAYSFVASESVSKRQQILANTVGKIDALVGQARGNFSAALSAATSGVGDFAGSVDDATKEIYTALGYKQNRNGTWSPTGAMINPMTGLPQSAGRPSTGYMGRHSGGYLGAFAGGATFTVGEAGPETVAILRNPRTHMLQGEGGGGAAPITININGPVVRDDQDISKLAHAVAAEVERTLSRKGQLLGLRAPAY